MNATNTGYKAKTFLLEASRIEILAGLRMTSDRSTGRWGYHQSPDLATRQYKVEWGESEAHPEGVDKWAADLNIKDNGDINIPHDAVEPYFNGKGAQLMLNIFCDMPKNAGYFAGMGFYKKPELYGFDLVTPQDETGRWIYSRPVHLTEAGKTHFFFLMTLKSTGGPNVELTVHKVTITRGNEHFHLTTKKHFGPKVFDLSLLSGLAEKNGDLRDLPIRKLVEAYTAWNS